MPNNIKIKANFSGVYDDGVSNDSFDELSFLKAHFSSFTFNKAKTSNLNRKTFPPVCGYEALPYLVNNRNTTPSGVAREIVRFSRTNLPDKTGHVKED